MFDSWQWLVGTFWIVPAGNLSAPLFASDRDQPIWLSDQTVWQITGHANGYFWGNAAVRMVPATQGSEPSSPVAQRLTASITPEAGVHMTFIPLATKGDAQGSIGIGHMRWRDGAWMAEMQMSAPLGSNQRILHWAYMVQCKPGDAEWQQLPGTGQSLPEFMKAAGFTIASRSM